MLLSRQDVAVAVASGATMLVDPRRLPPRLRRGYRIGMTGLIAAAAYRGTGMVDQDGDEGGEPLPPVGRAALAGGIGALVYGSFRGADRMGTASADWLTRRGVKRPRVVLAVAGTVLTLGMAALDKREEQREAEKASAEPDEMVEVTPDPSRGDAEA